MAGAGGPVEGPEGGKGNTGNAWIDPGDPESERAVASRGSDGPGELDRGCGLVVVGSAECDSSMRGVISWSILYDTGRDLLNGCEGIVRTPCSLRKER